MNDHEKGLYVLAELLHVPVYKLKAEMPTSEYMGWQEYLSEKNKVIEKASSGKPGSKNLLEGSTQDLIAGLTGGK